VYRFVYKLHSDNFLIKMMMMMMMINVNGELVLLSWIMAQDGEGVEQPARGSHNDGSCKTTRLLT